MNIKIEKIEVFDARLILFKFYDQLTEIIEYKNVDKSDF